MTLPTFRRVSRTKAYRVCVVLLQTRFARRKYIVKLTKPTIKTITNFEVLSLKSSIAEAKAT